MDRAALQRSICARKRAPDRAKRVFLRDPSWQLSSFLAVAGAAAGSSVLGPLGTIFGRLVGALAGNVIAQALFGGRRHATLVGPRLSDLTVMA